MYFGSNSNLGLFGLGFRPGRLDRTSIAQTIEHEGVMPLVSSFGYGHCSFLSSLATDQWKVPALYNRSCRPTRLWFCVIISIRPFQNLIEQKNCATPRLMKRDYTRRNP